MAKKIRNDVCVVGSGRFGNAVINQLVDLQKHVLAIDTSEKSLSQLPRTVKTIIGDASNIELLKTIGINKFNTVIVGVAENIEIVASLIQMGVENLIVKATSKRHERVLRTIGADVIILPEAEAGWRAALIASNQNFIKYSENLQDIGDGYTIGATTVTNEKWIGVPLKDLSFSKYGVSLVATKRRGKVHIPTGNFQISRGDKVTLIGKVESINKIFSQINTDTATKEIEIESAKKKIRG